MSEIKLLIRRAALRIGASIDMNRRSRWHLARTALFAGTLTVALFTACTADVPDVLGSTDTVRVAIFKSGEVENESVLSTNAEPVAALGRWLAANRRGWARDERTYAPGILLSTERFSINLLQGKIVVVSQHEEYVRDLSAEEYAALSAPFLR